MCHNKYDDLSRGDSLTREEFVRFAAEDFNIPMTRVRDAVDIVTEGICRAVEEGNTSIQFFGYWTIGAKLRPPKVGRHASTGEPIPIPAKYIPTFKAGKYLLEAVDTGFNLQKGEKGRKRYE